MSTLNGTDMFRVINDDIEIALKFEDSSVVLNKTYSFRDNETIIFKTKLGNDMMTIRSDSCIKLYMSDELITTFSAATCTPVDEKWCQYNSEDEIYHLQLKLYNTKVSDEDINVAIFSISAVILNIKVVDYVTFDDIEKNITTDT